MSKKDYKLLAKILFLNKPPDTTDWRAVYDRWLMTISDIADGLERTNSNFDYDRFYHAATTGEGVMDESS